MADWYGPLQDQVIAFCVATLPQLVAPGQDLHGTIYMDYQQLRASIFEYVKESGESGSGQPAQPPYLFINFGEAVTPGDWGINGEAKMIKPTFYYFDVDSQSDTVSLTDNDVMNDLVTLQRAIDSTAHTLFQSISYGMVDVSPADPVVRYLQGASKGRMVGGRISWPDGWQVAL